MKKKIKNADKVFWRKHSNITEITKINTSKKTRKVIEKLVRERNYFKEQYEYIKDAYDRSFEDSKYWEDSIGNTCNFFIDCLRENHISYTDLFKHQDIIVTPS